MLRSFIRNPTDILLRSDSINLASSAIPNESELDFTYDIDGICIVFQDPVNITMEFPVFSWRAPAMHMGMLAKKTMGIMKDSYGLCLAVNDGYRLYIIADNPQHFQNVHRIIVDTLKDIASQSTWSYTFQRNDFSSRTLKVINDEYSWVYKLLSKVLVQLQELDASFRIALIRLGQKSQSPVAPDKLVRAQDDNVITIHVGANLSIRYLCMLWSRQGLEEACGSGHYYKTLSFAACANFASYSTKMPPALSSIINLPDAATVQFLTLYNDTPHTRPHVQHAVSGLLTTADCLHHKVSIETV